MEKQFAITFRCKKCGQEQEVECAVSTWPPKAPLPDIEEIKVECRFCHHEQMEQIPS